MVIVPWHLGAEPFTFAAIAYGSHPETFTLVVPGEPRDRQLLFPLALKLARWFNERFEAPWELRNTLTRGTWSFELAPTAPQVWVPNEGAVTVLGKLGRRLAYLPTEERPGGPPAADPDLVRFGRHLMFLARNASRAGQQLVLAATTVAAANWATEQTVGERANLAALDAWIEPPTGVHGFDAACAVEELSAGPLPPPSIERDVADLVEAFNEARRRGDRQAEESVHAEVRAIYTALSETAWQLTWRVMERERKWPEEPRFVAPRWASDIEEYSSHMAWMNGPAGGRRRTRQTVPQAIRLRASAESERAAVEAQEAISDPLHLIPLLLDHRAVEGTLVEYDATHREVKRGKRNASRVPVVTLLTNQPCLIPVGKELWWTEYPDRVRVVVERVERDESSLETRVVLKVMEHLDDADHMRLAPQPLCFTQFSTRVPWRTRVSDTIPWSHQPPGGEYDPADVEEVVQ
ncbi:MAG: hypothetical protein M0Z46_09095 [Actinomycetota bacterium]|nr:hypothetical protein [Actinomycetota bacterium]